MNRIRTLRLARGLTQEELVLAMGGIVTKQALSKYENDKATPARRTAVELARALKVKAAELFAPPRYDIKFVAYRAYSRLGTRARAVIEGVVAEQLATRLELQERLGLAPTYSLETMPSAVPVLPFAKPPLGNDNGLPLLMSWGTWHWSCLNA